jgi:hypothetical protein
MSTPDRAIVASGLHPYRAHHRREGHVMRRLPHGGTRGPGPQRPGNGFGRPVGRPGPDHVTAALARLRREWWAGTTQFTDAVALAPLPALEHRSV